MKISENKLRSIIKSVLNESEFMPEDYLQRDFDHREMDSSHNMSKAKFCCDMSKEKLFAMCAKICSSNDSMTSECCKLYDCGCRGDVLGCCTCLDRICSCPICAQICSDCCSC